MKKGIVTTSSEVLVREAAKKLLNSRVGCLLVTENGIVKGILTKSDIIRSLADRKNPDDCKVSEIMEKNVTSCSPDINIYEGAKILSKKRVKRLPVLHKGKLEGIVSVSDLAPVLSKEMENISSYFWTK
jgi:CBS domain-containing protein